MRKWVKLIGIALSWFLLFSAAGIYIKKWWIENYGRGSFQIESLADVQSILALAATGALLVLILTLPHKDPNMTSWLDKNRYEMDTESARKRKAQHPQVPEQYLAKNPDGLVLGRQGDRYVRYSVEPGKGAGALILGQPGSGKSVLLLTSIIQWIHGEIKQKPTLYMVDVKPELYAKSAYAWDENIRELSIQDRTRWGWQIYDFHEGISDDDVLSELSIIANVLIDAGGNSKNAFFYNSAKSIFLAVCLYDYKQGKSFIQSIRHLMNASLQDTVQDILDKTESKPDMIKTRQMLTPFAGKDDSEAFGSIEMTLREKLAIFAKDDVAFFLDGNPRKLSPKTLEEQISIAFTIQSTKLNEYNTILKIVSAQILHHLEGRQERKDNHMIILVLDELARIAGAEGASESGTALARMIADFLAVSRSKNCFLVCALQGKSQLDSTFGKSGAETLLELVSVVAILSCASVSTAKMVCDWAGEYAEEKISESQGGKTDGNRSRSFDLKKILQPTDLMSLRQDGEIVLFLDGMYARVKAEGARYYRIKKLSEISEKCQKSHLEINQKTHDKEVNENE